MYSFLQFPLFNFAFTIQVALAGNFLGVTSSLLETVPESTVEATGLDTYYPRGDVKRIRGKGYTLTIPKEWVADTGLELIKAQRQARSLDYSSNKQSNRAGTGASTLPDAGKHMNTNTNTNHAQHSHRSLFIVLGYRINLYMLPSSSNEEAPKLSLILFTFLLLLLSYCFGGKRTIPIHASTKLRGN